MPADARHSLNSFCWRGWQYCTGRTQGTNTALHGPLGQDGLIILKGQDP